MNEYVNTHSDGYLCLNVHRVICSVADVSLTEDPSVKTKSPEATEDEDTPAEHKEKAPHKDRKASVAGGKKDRRLKPSIKKGTKDSNKQDTKETDKQPKKLKIKGKHRRKGKTDG